jgi:hypothetical protein
MKIFIGSSEKNKEYAQKIAERLKTAGFEVLPWWDPKVFQGGDVTIDRLIELSNHCDASIFVFGADDKILTDTKDGTKELATPRDNVVLEYGIFVGKHGRKKALFVPQPSIRIPSDLAGVTHLGEGDYLDKIVDYLKREFMHAPPSNFSNRVTLHVSRRLIEKLFTKSPIPAGWYSRAMYIGSRGAKYWAAIESDINYSGRHDFMEVYQLIQKLAQENNITNFDCIISLGPGVGNLDIEVLPALRGEQMVKYIPIDINHYLAVQSAERIDKSSDAISIPFCIIADFEEEWDFITDILREYTSPGRIFMMLGGTFGNLERSEYVFLQGLHDCMEQEDVAILDIFTKKEGYTIEKDPFNNLSELPATVKAFLAHGIERRTGFKLTVSKIMESFNEYVEFAEYKYGSKIPNTTSFAFCYKEDETPLIYVRRYDFQQFRNALSNRFEVIAADSTGDPTRVVQRSVFLLKKK